MSALTENPNFPTMSNLKDFILPLFTAKEMQELDHFSISQLGIDAEILMEEAAERLFTELCREYPEIRKKNVLILAGTGNNGADALSIARKLHFQKGQVLIAVFSKTEKQTSPLFRKHLQICKNLGMDFFSLSSSSPIDLSNYDYIIDGIYGTGYRSQTTPDSTFSTLVERINRTSATKIAIDIPSGLISGWKEKLRVNQTYSIGFPKQEFFSLENRHCCGKIKSLGLSVQERETSSYLVTKKIPLRHESSPFVHKYTKGGVLIIGGSPGKCGAPVFSAMSSFSGGAGIVTVLTAKENLSNVTQYQKEPVYDTLEHLPRYASQYPVTLIGPGFHFSQTNEQKELSLIVDFLSNYDGQLLLDASFFSLFTPQEIRKLKHPPILTPHTGEFVTFFKEEAKEIKTKTLPTIQTLAEKYQAFILFKDTFMALGTPDSKIFVFDRPNRIASQAGSGDILAGFISGLIASHPTPPIEHILIYAVQEFYTQLETFSHLASYPPRQLIRKLNFIDRKENDEKKSL